MTQTRKTASLNDSGEWDELEDLEPEQPDAPADAPDIEDNGEDDLFD